MRIPISVPVLFFAIVGCGRQPPSAVVPAPTATVEVPKDADEKLRQQIRSASFQLSAALDSIQSSLEAAKALTKVAGAPKELKVGLMEVVELLDDAGSSIADFTQEPAALPEFRKDLASGEKTRKEAIDGCNDALHDFQEAQDIIAELTESAPGKFQNPLEGVEGPMDEAGDAIRGALEALGGKPEKSSGD